MSKIIKTGVIQNTAYKNEKIVTKTQTPVKRRLTDSLYKELHKRLLFRFKMQHVTQFRRKKNTKQMVAKK